MAKAAALRKAAIGFRAHSGWAALVAVTGSIEAPEVAARRRIELADLKVRGSKQPYHAAEPLEFPEAKKFLEGCAAATGRMASEALEAAIAGLRDRGCHVVGCGITLASGRTLPDLQAILKSHALIHTAEGEFYRNALIEAAKKWRLPVLGVKERDIEERASEKIGRTKSEIERRVGKMGKGLGPPWTQDQKFAALVAWMALV